MKRVMTVFAIVLVAMLAGAHAQAADTAVPIEVVDAVLTCDGTVTFRIANPEDVTQPDVINVEVYLGNRFVNGAFTFITPDQESGSTWFNPTLWSQGIPMHASVHWNQQNYALSPDVMCGNVEPTATATATPLPTAEPTSVPATNAFDLTSAQRMCADQSFHASWTGSNVASVEFALSNTSDSWTSGWLAADPTSGAFTSAVDHHAYDKVMARATFADGTTMQEDADVGTYVAVPQPEPGGPVVAPPPAQPGAVTALPVTGAGEGSVGRDLMLVAGAAIVLGGLAVAGARRSALR